jgi:hypothetical protein
VAVPQQLPQIAILYTGYPHPREPIFHHQLQQESGILLIVLLLPYAFGLDLRRVADPQLVLQLRQQTLEPARVPRSFDPHADTHFLLLQFPVKYLRFSIAVQQSAFTTFSALGV